MKTETTLLKRPTKQQIMAFTQEMIEALPTWRERDKLQAGSFAKETWLKAKSSLVFICKNDMNSTTISYCSANPFNGHFSTRGYFCTVLKKEVQFNDMWVHSTSTPDDFEYLFEPIEDTEVPHHQLGADGLAMMGYECED